MWLVDAVVRRGHLSEEALAEAIITGQRPIHLDRCELCAERVVEMSRWLDAVRDVAVDAADRAFPPERLAAQQAQILRKLEQADEPARVIAFPASPRIEAKPSGRRVASGWLGVAAAAGLVIGVIGGQVSARFQQPLRTAAAPAAVVLQPASVATPAVDTTLSIRSTSWLDEELEHVVTPLSAMEELTPRLVQTAAAIR